jgi:hypothetical protein
MARALKADHFRNRLQSAVPDRANIVRLSISSRRDSRTRRKCRCPTTSRSVTLTATLFDCTALARTAHTVEVSSVLFCAQLAKPNDPSGFGNCTWSSVTPCATIVSRANDEAKPSVRFRSDSMPIQTARVTIGLRQRLHSSTPRHSYSASIASKTISAGITAKIGPEDHHNARGVGAIFCPPCQ